MEQLKQIYHFFKENNEKEHIFEEVPEIKSSENPQEYI